SGTVSVALGIHGPNFGVGGGPHAVAEGLVTGLSVLSENRLPGVWMIFTEMDPEPVCDASVKVTNAPVVHAVALAIEREISDLGLQLVRQRGLSPVGGSVKELAEFFTRRDSWSCPFAGLGTVEINLMAAV